LSTLDVYARPAKDNGGPTMKGRLTFFDNAVDPGTGTVTMKAEFANDANTLWPGQFVEVELILAVEAATLTVPGGAIVTGQDGTFIYVVGPDKKVQKRPVKVNRILENVAVIDQGLQAGETVVIDGQMRLVPGAAVEFKPNLQDPGRSR
jgi:multidrug efflux system membrane fusion protein